MINVGSVLVSMIFCTFLSQDRGCKTGGKNWGW